MQATKIQLSKELVGIIREKSDAPVGTTVQQQYKVKNADAVCSPLQTLVPDPPSLHTDDPDETIARGRELSQGLCCKTRPDRMMMFQFRAGQTILSPGIQGPILAFDIETTGLGDDATVTCVSAWDPERGVNFCEACPDGSRIQAFVDLLDSAPLLCAFNGVRFDIPFLAKRWGLNDKQIGEWVLKMIDPFEACKLALGRTFSLDRALKANGIACKTGSGLEAVRLARESLWAELKAYCMADTKKTHELICKQEMIVPNFASRY